MNNNIITNKNRNYDYTLFAGTQVLRELALSSNQVSHLKPELTYIDKYSTSNTVCTKTLPSIRSHLIVLYCQNFYLLTHT